MKIKRFFAPDMRRAIQQVRNEHGPDAVILSSRSVDGGAEIVLAVDYDHNLVMQMVGSPRSCAVDREPAAADAPTDDAVVAAIADTAASKPTSAAPRDALAAAVSSVGTDAREPLPDAAGGGADGVAAVTPVRSAPDASRRSAPLPSIEWSPDPALKAMQQELAAMKGMLSEQFSRLSWADLKTFHPARALLMRRVAELGLEPELAQQLVAEIVHPDDRRQAWRELMLGIARRLRVVKQDPLDDGGVFALIGPTGVGKTTTIAKLAARYCLRHGSDSLALISTDCFRVGAQRQLDAFGAILGVPVRRADSADELTRLLAELADRRVVLIDTAGMAPRDRRLGESLRQLADRDGLRRMLVLSANMQASVMRDAVHFFGGESLSGIALTKLDEANGLGAALSVLAATRLPAVWLSEGQRVPEDLKLARVLHLISWLTDVQAGERAEGLPPQPWMHGAVSFRGMTDAAV